MTRPNPRTRITVPHTDLTDTEFDYHEWCLLGVKYEDAAGRENRDRIGRTGNHGAYTWLTVVCNNIDCGGRAVVREDWLLDIIALDIIADELEGDR